MRQSDSAYPKLGVIHAAILSIMGSRYSPQHGRPLEPAEIARLLGLPLKRTLPALGALGKAGLLNCRGRQWSLTPDGQRLVDENAPDTPQPPDPDPAAIRPARVDSTATEGTIRP